jgi:hypothetical protein
MVSVPRSVRPRAMVSAGLSTNLPRPLRFARNGSINHCSPFAVIRLVDATEFVRKFHRMSSLPR